MYGSIFQDTHSPRGRTQTDQMLPCIERSEGGVAEEKTAIICEVRQSSGDKEETQKGKREESYTRVPSSLRLSVDLHEPESTQDSGRITKEQLTKQSHKLT